MRLDAIELTGGSSLSNPMYLFRGRRLGPSSRPPCRRRYGPAFGWWVRRFLQDYPFEEAFFLPYARQFLDALDLPLILLGGVNRLETVERALAEGFAFVAMARALLREPDLVGRWEKGEPTEGSVHPLQQVHADHLQRDPVRARPRPSGPAEGQPHRPFVGRLVARDFGCIQIPSFGVGGRGTLSLVGPPCRLDHRGHRPALPPLGVIELDPCLLEFTIIARQRGIERRVELHRLQEAWIELILVVERLVPLFKGLSTQWLVR